MAIRSQNTMVEGLQALMQDITSLKATPDADVAFLIGLETTILGKLRERFDTAAGQVAPPPGNAMELGGGMGMGPMGGAAEMGAGAGLEAIGAGMMGQGAAALGAPGGPPGGMPGRGGPAPAPAGPRFNPDVLRRALRGGGIQGG